MSFKENLEAIGDFIEKTGGPLTTCFGIGTVGVVIIAYLHYKYELPPWAQLLLAGGSSSAVAYEPKRSGSTSMFQQPVDQVTIAPSASSIDQVSTSGNRAIADLKAERLARNIFDDPP